MATPCMWFRGVDATLSPLRMSKYTAVRYVSTGHGHARRLVAYQRAAARGRPRVPRSGPLGPQPGEIKDIRPPSQYKRYRECV
eukprot:2006137-Rhodomonas_salina.2